MPVRPLCLLHQSASLLSSPVLHVATHHCEGVKPACAPSLATSPASGSPVAPGGPCHAHFCTLRGWARARRVGDSHACAHLLGSFSRPLLHGSASASSAACGAAEVHAPRHKRP